jgi:hypothetical protein
MLYTTVAWQSRANIQSTKYGGPTQWKRLVVNIPFTINQLPTEASDEEQYITPKITT